MSVLKSEMYLPVYMQSFAGQIRVENWFSFYRSPPAFSQYIFHGSMPKSGSSPVPTSCAVYLSCVLLHCLSLQKKKVLSSGIRLTKNRKKNRILTAVSVTKAASSSMESVGLCSQSDVYQIVQGVITCIQCFVFAELRHLYDHYFSPFFPENSEKTPMKSFLMPLRTCLLYLTDSQTLRDIQFRCKTQRIEQRNIL